MEKVTGNGISSAPEIFQRNMNEIIEGLEGVEVVADDFLIISKWKNKEEGIIDNDNKMLKFLQSWKENSLHLNPDKIQLRKDESKYIGHLIITRGIKVDLSKDRSYTKDANFKGHTWSKEDTWHVSVSAQILTKVIKQEH